MWRHFKVGRLGCTRGVLQRGSMVVLHVEHCRLVYDCATHEALQAGYIIVLHIGHCRLGL